MRPTQPSGVSGVAGLANGRQPWKVRLRVGRRGHARDRAQPRARVGTELGGGRQGGAAARLGISRADGEHGAGVGRGRRRGRQLRHLLGDDLAARRAHGGDTRDGARGVPVVRLVADARKPRAGEAEVGRARRVGVGGMGHHLSRRRWARARLDAVRAFAAVSAGSRSPGRAGLGRCGSRHLRVSPFGFAALGRAIALPGGDRRDPRQRRPRARGVRVPLSGGNACGRAVSRAPNGLSRAISWPTSDSGLSAPPAESSWRDSISGGFSPSRKALGRRCSRSSRKRFSRHPHRRRRASRSRGDFRRRARRGEEHLLLDVRATDVGRSGADSRRRFRPAELVLPLR